MSKKEKREALEQRLQENILPKLGVIGSHDAVLGATFIGLTFAYKNGLDLLQKAFEKVSKAGEFFGLSFQDMEDEGWLPYLIKDSLSEEGMLGTAFANITKSRIVKETHRWKSNTNKALYDQKRARENQLNIARSNYSRMIEQGANQQFIDKQALDIEKLRQQIADLEQKIRDNPETIPEHVKESVWKQLELEDWLIAMGFAGGTIFLLQEYSVSELVEAIPFIE